MKLLGHKRRRITVSLTPSGRENVNPNTRVHESLQQDIGHLQKFPLTVATRQGSSPWNVDTSRDKHLRHVTPTTLLGHSHFSSSSSFHMARTSDDQLEAFTASSIEPDVWSIGQPTQSCVFCGAKMWVHERLAKGGANNTILFSICCMSGKVTLPLLPVPPPLLWVLLNGDDQRALHYQKHIRAFNGMFSFTSMAGKIHLLPQQSSKPKFAQLYFYDTKNEVQNRINTIGVSNQDPAIDHTIVADLTSVLDFNNSLAKCFRYARQRFTEDSTTPLQLRLIKKRNTDGRRYNLPSASEVAALIVGDFDADNLSRDVVIQTHSNLLKRIDVNHPQYLALQYPLLFPYGEDGFRSDILISDERSKQQLHKRESISMREFLSFRIQMRSNESQVLLKSRRLFQQFLVDSYTMVEAERLQYHRFHQSKFHSHQLQGLHECLIQGETQAARTGKRVILPSSFVGGPQYMYNNCKDAFAIGRYVGYPSYFITITCNPEWTNIKDCIAAYSLKPSDRPDIISRVFKIKLDVLLKDLKDGSIFGKPKGIEFQKRGLPHCHILLFVQPAKKPRSSVDIDHHISAEIPDEHTQPKLYKRSDNGRSTTKRNVNLDNRFVVPYNATWLLKYGCHINVEYTCQTSAIKYLFKYVHKGNDRVTASFFRSHDSAGSDVTVDEIQNYYDCRYISACEASWRLFGFEIQYKEPNVIRLPFHLPNEQNVLYEDYQLIENVIDAAVSKDSMFIGWFKANKNFDLARTLTYAEMPSLFVWDKRGYMWRPRKQGNVIGRLTHIPHSHGEEYFLRLLLNYQKGCQTFADVHSVGGIVYDTFKEACYALGLLQDDREFIDALNEASAWASPNYFRRLFAMLLMSNNIVRPDMVWEKCWQHCVDNSLLSGRHNLGFQCSVREIKSITLAEIEKLLQPNGRSLNEFPDMPFPDYAGLPEPSDSIFFDELNFDRTELASIAVDLISRLNRDQRVAFDTIATAVHHDTGGFFFVCGYGGTGKTFLWNALSASIRSKGDIVLNVASSGIAALLLPNGQTAHSRFKVPLSVNQDSICNIRQGTPLARLISSAKLVIWDEAPMLNKFCFEALDKCLKDVLRFDRGYNPHAPFGGKIVVLGGDFHQILPVIPRGSREEIFHSCINASNLWQSCQVLQLTENMRLSRGSRDIHGV
ncbi:uncharacterized protein LOC107469212 [Arachis duranensis]|uniref:ATP-dependent DNA helicase n=1 Tax=Arachis duranensis TaxID=130453 RepID=A0A6P4BQI0_ARADU|nr:uncharacterized protein LOC107469212 [Arachis duranensis]